MRAADNEDAHNQPSQIARGARLSAFHHHGMRPEGSTPRKIYAYGVTHAKSMRANAYIE